jgi:hypothetical protein
MYADFAMAETIGCSFDRLGTSNVTPLVVDGQINPVLAANHIRADDSMLRTAPGRRSGRMHSVEAGDVRIRSRGAS